MNGKFQLPLNLSVIVCYFKDIDLGEDLNWIMSEDLLIQKNFGK